MKKKIDFSDGWHPTKEGYVEWWYFTLICEDGCYISGVLAIKDKTPHVWLSINSEAGKPIYVNNTHAFKDFKASRRSCNVKIKNSYIKEHGKDIKIKVKEGNIDLCVDIKRIVTWRDNKISGNVNKKEKAMWIVPCLKGDFIGYLKIGNRKHKMKGLAFHDHVWNNIKTTTGLANFNQWYWGIALSRDFACLFVCVRFKRRIFKFLCFEENGKVMSSNDEIKEKDFKIETDGKFPPKNIDIFLKGEKFVEIKLKKEHKIPFISKNPLANTILENVVGISKVHLSGNFKNTKERGRSFVEMLRFQLMPRLPRKLPLSLKERLQSVFSRGNNSRNQ